LIEDFYKALDTSYAPPNAKQDALRRLSSFKQGFGSLESYISTFRSLTQKAGITGEMEKIHLFKNGLAPKIAYKTISMGPGDTIDEWYKTARRADQVVQAKQDYKRSTKGYPSSKPYQSFNSSYPKRSSSSYRPLPYQSTPSQSFGDPYTMDVDLITRKLKKSTIRNVEQETSEDSSEFSSDEDSDGETEGEEGESSETPAISIPRSENSSILYSPHHRRMP